VKTRIISFELVEEAQLFHQQYHRSVVASSEGREWAEYCKDISKLEGVLFHYDSMFVPWLESKELRELINDISQLVVYHGLFMEEHLRRTNSPLFPFLDHVHQNFT
jgi:hypothetical protein